MPQNRKADIKSVDNRYMYHVVIGYKFTDQGKHYSQNDSKANDPSVEMKKSSNGYLGCGLDDFY